VFFIYQLETFLLFEKHKSELCVDNEYRSVGQVLGDQVQESWESDDSDPADV